MDVRIVDLVARLREGHALTPAELRALLDEGCDPDALLDALVAAADAGAPGHSRRFHRALGLLRDARRPRP